MLARHLFSLEAVEGLMPRNERGYRVPTLATDAVLILEGQVLLVQRGSDPFRGSWALPGGFVEVGETVEEACVREVAEETGVPASPASLVGVYSDPARDPRGHVVSVVFHVEPDEMGADARPGDDAAEVGWFPVEEPPELAFDHADIFADWYAGSSDMWE